MQKTFTTNSNQETIALGNKLGALLKGGEFLALTGDLGGGKTQFTKGIAAGLGIKETVVSPTFTIERIYGKLHHFDLYRVSEDREIREQIKDLSFDGGQVIVVEWPDNISEILPVNYISIHFGYIDENVREIVISTNSEKYKNILEKL